jgi:hypothetical protein
MYTFVHTYTHTYIRTYMYTFVHTYIHVYIHKYSFSFVSRVWKTIEVSTSCYKASIDMNRILIRRYFSVNSHYHVRFQVLTEASLKMIAFWDIARCSLVVVDRRFRGSYCPDAGYIQSSFPLPHLIEIHRVSYMAGLRGS